MKTLYDLNPLAYQLQQIYEIQQRFKPLYILTPQPAIADFAREHQRQLKLLTKQFEIINKMANSKVFDFPNIINSAVYTYHNTDAEVFEINVEDQSVEISKTSLNKGIQKLMSSGVDKETAVKLALACFILYNIYPVIFMLPPHILNSFLSQITKYIYDVGLSLKRKSSEKLFELNNPDYMADFLIDQTLGGLLTFITNLFK